MDGGPSHAMPAASGGSDTLGPRSLLRAGEGEVLADRSARAAAREAKSRSERGRRCKKLS